MIEQKRTHTEIEFTYKQKVLDSSNVSNKEKHEEWFVLFIMDNDYEIVKMGKSKGDMSAMEGLPFEMLSEVVRSIELWKRSPEIKIVRPMPRGATMTDFRDNNSDKEINEPSNKNQISAQQIQELVDTSMNNLDAEIEMFNSLSQDKEETDDPTGLSTEEISSLGPVPETPKHIKDQLEDIKKERVNKSSSKRKAKKIKRKD